jgi:electron transfer flavoprotein beta subunit
MLAERLGLPQITSVRTLDTDGSTLRAERVRDGGYSEVTSSLPAVVSVTEKINEPRYPSFKGIMAAKKKPVTTLGIADLGLDDGSMGLANASTVVVDGAPRPPRQAGEKITDDGAGGAKVAEYLATARLI